MKAVSNGGYGVPVDTDDVSSALESTRLLRLANVLWDGLPDDMNQGPVRDTLETSTPGSTTPSPPPCAHGD
jgi:hypothetical protein